MPGESVWNDRHIMHIMCLHTRSADSGWRSRAGAAHGLDSGPAWATGVPRLSTEWEPAVIAHQTAPIERASGKAASKCAAGATVVADRSQGWWWALLLPSAVLAGLSERCSLKARRPAPLLDLGWAGAPDQERRCSKVPQVRGPGDGVHKRGIRGRIQMPSAMERVVGDFVRPKVHTWGPDLVLYDTNDNTCYRWLAIRRRHWGASFTPAMDYICQAYSGYLSTDNLEHPAFYTLPIWCAVWFSGDKHALLGYIPAVFEVVHHFP